MKVANFVTGQREGNAISYYKQGAAIGGPWIATPGFLRDEMNRLFGEAKSIGGDIESARAKACALPGGGRDFTKTGDSSCAKLNRFVANTWSPFLFELEEFKLNHQHFHQRLWGAYYTEIQEYRKRLIGLRRIAVALGIEATAPEPKLPPPPVIEEIGAFLRTIIYILVGGALVWFIFNTIIPLFKGGAVAATA
jgi:hypothetical protein